MLLRFNVSEKFPDVKENQMNFQLISLQFCRPAEAYWNLDHDLVAKIYAIN